MSLLGLVKKEVPMAKRNSSSPSKTLGTSSSVSVKARKPAAKSVVVKKATPAVLPAAPAEVLVIEPPTKDQIATRAYEIWVAKGRIAGEDLINWQQAERELLAEAQKRAAKAS